MVDINCIFGQASKKTMKKLIILFPVISLIYVSYSILNNQFFSVHDDQQVARIYLLTEALKSGQFPVRWVDHLGFGYGYPLFIFYPPFIYYLGAIFHLFGISLIFAVKIIIFLSFLLSIASMYLLLKKFYSTNISIICSTFYVLTSYRALDVYVRGALSEAFSFVFLPLILLNIYNIFETKPQKILKSFIFLSLTFAGLILTHTLTALGFSLIIFVWSLALFRKFHSVKKSLITIASLVLGGGLSAFSSIPSIIEKKFTLVDGILLTELADFRIHFVYIRQLWNSAWGYGGSLPELNDGMSFEVGKVILIAIIISVGVIAYNVFKNKKLSFNYLLPLFILIPIFMTLKYSKPIWQLIQPLAYLQFPWRFLTFVTLFTPFVFAFLSQEIGKKNKKYSYLFLTVVFIMVILESVGRFSPKSFKQFSDADYLTKQRLDWATSRSSFEYIPKGVKTKLSNDFTTVPAIEESNMPQNTSVILDGEGFVESIYSEPGRQKYRATFASDAKVQFNTFDFPGWQVKINGEKVNFSSENDLRLITVSVPQGKSIIELNFSRTPIRLISEIISLVSVLIIICVLFLKKVKNVGLGLIN